VSHLQDGERSDIPRLQQVEQKAVGRQRNLGIRIVVWILVTYMYPQCMKVHHPNASSIISIIINIWLYFVLALCHLCILFLQLWHIFVHLFLYIIYNMKRARPWMLANLKIIWQFHSHPVHQKVSRFFGPRYIGDNFF
jgi:hypothetical protein